jgi:hypothetical protein
MVTCADCSCHHDGGLCLEAPSCNMLIRLLSVLALHRLARCGATSSSSAHTAPSRSAEQPQPHMLVGKAQQQHVQAEVCMCGPWRGVQA